MAKQSQPVTSEPTVIPLMSSEDQGAPFVPDPHDIQDPATPEPALAGINLSNPDVIAALGRALGVAVSDGMRSMTRQKVTNGEYAARLAATKHRLTCTVFQNAWQLNDSQLSNEDIDLLNQINRSGRYIERQVEVIFNDTSGEKIVLIRYDNATADQMFKLRGDIRSFTDMIRQIVVAQTVENDEDQAQRDAISELRRKKRS